MTTKQAEVCNYYKQLHPGAVILYHLPGRYVALGDDGGKVAKSLSTIVLTDDDVACFADNFALLSELGKCGAEICLIEYRNDDGVLDFPDLERIRIEKEMDY